MSKVVLDVAMSLDGFTAGPDIGAANPMGKGGERLHEWMWTAGNEPDGEVDVGFSPVNATVGGAVIGRRTFDLGVGPWGGTPWPSIPSFVVTHRTREDLLGEVRIHLVPLLLGEGTPLFAGERGELIQEGKPVAGAVTHLRYRVAQP
jgi:dihydrofolate reductase